MSTSLSSIATYYIVNKQTGLYVCPPPSGVEPGFILTQKPSGNTAAFQFAVLITDADDAEMRIFNASSGMSIDAQGNQQPPGQGTSLIPFAWRNQGNQIWEPDTMMTNAYATIASTYDSSMVWDVMTFPVGDLKFLILNPADGSDSQQFMFVPA
jgi:hypothetical protein